MKLGRLFPAPFRGRVNRYRERRDQARDLRRLARDAGCRFGVSGRSAVVACADKEIWISNENLAYAQDLIRNFDYYFGIVEPTRRGRRLLVDYRKTALHALRPAGLAFWFPELPEAMETTAIYLERAALGPGEIVLDLGAYAGGAAYHFSRAVGSAGRVFAFEPDPKSFDCLLRNIELHRLENVIPDRRGVWSESGRVLFQAEGNLGSAVVDASDRASDERRWVDVVSLDDFAREARLERVDFVKMDIEGSEAAVLASAGAFLQKFRPNLIIEVHRVRGERTDASVIAILEACGYRVEVVDQAGLPLPLISATLPAR